MIDKQGEKWYHRATKKERMLDMKEWIQSVRTGEQKQVSREDCPPIGILCNGFECLGDCPIWKKVEKSNGYNSCRDWMMDHWEEGLKLLEWEKVEGEKVEDVDMKQETIKQRESEHDYFLMRHLGVGYRERFHVEGTDGVYYVGVAGRLFRVYDEEMGGKREIENGQVLYNLLEHPEKVRKIRLTEEHREYLEAVMKVLPEVQWVKRDGGWLLFGTEDAVLLTRVGEDWEELGEGKEIEMEELLGK